MGYKIQLTLFATMTVIWPSADQKKKCTIMKLVDSLLDDQMLDS